MSATKCTFTPILPGWPIGPGIPGGPGGPWTPTPGSPGGPIGPGCPFGPTSPFRNKYSLDIKNNSWLTSHLEPKYPCKKVHHIKQGSQKAIHSLSKKTTHKYSEQMIGNSLRYKHNLTYAKHSTSVLKSIPQNSTKDYKPHISFACNSSWANIYLYV